MRRQGIIGTLTAAALACGLVWAAPAWADDNSRLATAREVIELSGVSDALNRMMDTLKPLFVAGVQGRGQIPQADAEHLGDLFMEEMHNSMPGMVDAVALAYAHEFTDEQLTAIRDFYRQSAPLNGRTPASRRQVWPGSRATRRRPHGGRKTSARREPFLSSEKGPRSRAALGVWDLGSLSN